MVGDLNIVRAVLHGNLKANSLRVKLVRSLAELLEGVIMLD